MLIKISSIKSMIKQKRKNIDIQLEITRFYFISDYIFKFLVCLTLQLDSSQIF